jgi:hypothetical protein
MSIFGTPGPKSRWAREVDVNDPEDVLILTNAQASVFSVISAKAVTDNSGNRWIVVDAVATAATFNLTDCANFGIGSTIKHTAALVPTLYVKVGNSATPVVGDWWKQPLTQASAQAS